MKLSTSITSGPSPGSVPAPHARGGRDVEHTVELADVPERERPQEGAQCRGCHHPMPQDQAGRPGPEHVHLIDPIGAREHLVQQRHHLPTRQRRAGQPRVKPDRLVHQFLDLQTVRERRGHQQSGVADQSLLIETPRAPNRGSPGQPVRPLRHAPYE
ncbi:MAG: hypothetical protein ACRDK7_04510 [Solirubrobacteraceae bacterium]